MSAVLAGTSDAGALLVAGEAGVGKSRLVAAAAQAAADALVAPGWCLPILQGLPYLPLIDALRSLAEADDGSLLKAALAQCPAFVAGELSRLMPYLDCPETSDSQQWTPGESDDGWRKLRLFDAVRRVLAAAAQVRRVAVVFEDVHWADASTLEVLDYLLAPGHASGFALVLTCRTEETLGQPVTEWMERVHRNELVTRLDLGPLSERETAQQIELLLGERPSQRLVADTYARSEGNAFFTEQLITAGGASGHRGGLPAGLKALLLSRTAQLRRAAQEVLAALAVAGRPMAEESIAELCDRRLPELREVLRELSARRLLRQTDPADRHQLRHALLAEAVGAQLLPGERASLHGRVADLLASWDDPNLAAEIAAHYAAAGRRADELHWRVIAGRHADAVFASNEAAWHWRRALELTADVPAAQPVEGMSLAQLYGYAEDAFTSSGREEVAHELCEQALARLSDVGPADRADVLRRAGEMRGIDTAQHGLDLLHQALELYERLPPSAGQAKTLRDIATILHNDGRQAAAAAAIDQGAAVAERAHLRAARLELLPMKAWYELASGSGDGSAAVEQIQALTGELDDTDEPGLHAWLAMCHTYTLGCLGRLAEIEAAGAPALQLAHACGTDQSLIVTMLRSNVFEALIELGSIDDATVLIEPLSDGRPGVSTRLDYESRAMVEMLRGDLQQAHRRWLEIHALPPTPLAFQIDSWLRECELPLWRGEPQVALKRTIALLDATAQASQEGLTGSLAPFAGRLLVMAVRAGADCLEQARADRDCEAEAVALRQAQRLPGLCAALRPDPFTAGPMSPTADADRLCWLAEWARLRGESDPVLWERSAAEWDALSRPHRGAYCRWRQAEALLARPGERPAASRVLRIAGSQAAQHVPLATAVAELARLARIELIAPPGTSADHPPAESSRPFGLTDRELAVLRLLAQGRTNHQIGEALFISTRTASVHVTHILRKLNVTSRVQAATVAERARLW